MEIDDSGDDTYELDTSKQRRRPTNKRRKAPKRGAKPERDATPALSEGAKLFPFQPLLDLVEWTELDDADAPPFDALFGGLLLDFVRVRDEILERESGQDAHGRTLRPLTRAEASSLIEIHSNPLDCNSMDDSSEKPTHKNVALRKLKLQRISMPSSYGPSTSLSPLISPRPIPPPNPAVLDALYAIRTTPYASSFASRIHGRVQEEDVVAVDWDWDIEGVPWMAVMADVRAHYALARAEREQPLEFSGPIAYVTLQAHHLEQVHDLLERVFWAGIDGACPSPPTATI
ncbi:hypothetical protein HWV62_19611 [Athelia sp. TMB]|nr:hypothetical protein HWV62_19611 [Athelia sp. TMB]